MTLSQRVAGLAGPERYDFNQLPSYAQEGGEEYDCGWLKDCQGKTDFDPVLLRACCRVYPDGRWIGSIILGADTTIAESGIQSAGTKTAAKAAAEQWCSEQVQQLLADLSAALSARGL